MKINSITVLNEGGVDTIYFHTDIFSPSYPYNQNAAFKIDSAKYLTDAWIAENFPGIIVTKISLK